MAAVGSTPLAPATCQSSQAEDAIPFACCVCREPIRESATKCIHCDSFQDWRRYFSVSTIVLTLLVALISVLTAAIPVIRTAFTADRARIQYATTTCTTEKVGVFASNVGTRVAAVTGATLEQVVDGQVAKTRSLGIVDPKVIGPREWMPLELQPPENMLLPHRPAEAHRCEYRITLHVKPLTGAAASPSDPALCACPDEP